MVTPDRGDVGSTANRYEVLAKLATGGMAEIFLARTRSDAGVERYVVVKRVHKHRATDITFVHMFLDEARLAAMLQHPNIAQVYDTGKLGDTYFFTMEYVHGETVREILHRAFEMKRPVPLAVALTIVAAAAAGLQHAHERVSNDGKPLQIVHRDVSPSNLMVSFEGHTKILDFGVAKAAHRSVETQSGTVKGKMGYMAPEQCRGGDVDRRCDLFSLGIVLWELLVAERLFKRATDFESMEAIVSEPTPPPSSLRPEIPKALDALTLKLLAKNPRDRFQSADTLLEALEAVATETGIGISIAAVRRYVRELFGTPPEPWHELRRSDSREDVVTVTGAPIQGRPELLELEGDELDRLRDLSVTPRGTMPVRAPAGAAAAMNRAPSGGDDETSSGELVPIRRSRRWWTVVAVTAVSAATIALALIALRRTDTPDAVTVPDARIHGAPPIVDSSRTASPDAAASGAVTAFDAGIDAAPPPDLSILTDTPRGTTSGAAQRGLIGSPGKKGSAAKPPDSDPPPIPPKQETPGGKPTCNDPDPMACRH